MLSSFLPASLTRRLTLYYAAAFFVFLGASYLLLFWSINAVLESKMDEDLAEDIEEFSEVLSNTGVDGVITDMEKEVIGGEHETVFLQLYRSGKQLIHSTNLDNWATLDVNESLISEQFDNATENTLVTLDFPHHESETRVVYGRISPDYMMVIGESNEERDDVMELLFIVFMVVFLITLPLASLMVWLLTRRSIAGIKSVSNAAQHIKSGNLDTRVNAVGQANEVQTLADTFDAMADRIQDLIRNMREMTDNVAHDLRSPISRVRLLCESALQSPDSPDQFEQAAKDSIAECDRLIKMINTSLDVVETEAGVITRARAEFDVHTLVDDACELFEPVADEKNISLTTDIKTQCKVFGDVTSVQRLVANVLDNAIKYTRPGGMINVQMTSNNDEIEVLVTDNGIGVDSKDYENIFSRFYRVDPSRTSSGCGLGLSYARAVARAHGGDITVTSKRGCYTTFRITLPCTSEFIDEH